MKTKIIGLLVSLAGLSLTAAEPQYVIPEGGTHFVGKTGLGFQNRTSNKFRIKTNADGSSVVLKVRAVGTCILFR